VDSLTLESSHITGLLRSQAEDRPDSMAVITPQGCWTYAEWLAEAERVAAALAIDWVGPGDTVALLAPNSLQWLAVAFGASAVGARLAPINTWVKGPELADILHIANPSVLIMVSKWARQDFLADLRRARPELWGTAGWHPGDS
jgi:acyl-CoA synthetase (AMP-forming)/AMP-acid ligase II